MPDRFIQSTSAPSERQCTCDFQEITQEDDTSIANLSYKCSQLKGNVDNAILYSDFDWYPANQEWSKKDGELKELEASILAKRRLLPLCGECAVSIFIRDYFSNADFSEPDRYSIIVWKATFSQ